MSQIQRRWFQAGDGIKREVITADIQRYLGRDALVRPGTNEHGVNGYWITAYRALTTEMVQDLQRDSRSYTMESQQTRGQGSAEPKIDRVWWYHHPDFGVVPYPESQTHASRQTYGPTQPHPDAQYTTAQPAQPRYPPDTRSSTSVQQQQPPVQAYPAGYTYPQQTVQQAQSAYSQPSQSHYTTAPGYGHAPATQQRTVADPYATHATPRYATTESAGYYDPRYQQQQQQQQQPQRQQQQPGAMGASAAYQSREQVHPPGQSTSSYTTYDPRHVQPPPDPRSRRR